MSNDDDVRQAIRDSKIDETTPANWPIALRKCIWRAKQAGVTVEWNETSDPIDVWTRLNFALSRAAHKNKKPEEYFITFTVPVKEEHKDPKRVLIRALHFAKRYSAQFQWCLELNKEGMPHVHMLVKPNTSYALSVVKKKVNSMNLNFGKAKWFQKARKREDVLNYIKKHETKPEPGYLKKWGIDIFKGDLQDLKNMFPAIED